MPMPAALRFASALWLAISTLFLFAGPAAAVSPADPTSAQLEFFEKQVRPLLSQTCFSCHGDKKQEGGLRLDRESTVRAGGDSGPAFVAGNPDQSLLIQAVRRQGELKMPPDQPLTNEQISVLARWIEQGAIWPPSKPADDPPLDPNTSDPRKHWAFQPRRRPVPPDVRNVEWLRSPLDRFVLARLENRGLPPAPPADKATLLRRATFDLTGLPPTADELHAFLADDSPDAFARVVDRLLASPAYGQRWARHWLDVVRYTDSFDARILTGDGSVMDITQAWRYRDWVVDALNRDLPYDQFITDQIAGDLAHANADDRRRINGIVATGMLAIGNWGGGDADKEKLLTDIADDQVDVVCRAFMGLTVACARCHDHKFDPISTRDYYGLAGIFFSSHILPNVGPKTNGPPMLRIPLESAADRARRELAQARIAQIESDQRQLQEQGLKSLVARILPDTDKYLTAVQELDAANLSQVAKRFELDEFVLSRWAALLGLEERQRLDKPVRDVAGLSGLFAWTGASPAISVTVNTTAADANFSTVTLPPRSVAVHPSPTGGVALVWTSPFAGRVRLEGTLADADDKCGNGIDWQVKHGPAALLAAGSIANGAVAPIPAQELDIQPGDRVELVVSPRGEYSCDTTVVTFRLTEVAGQKRSWELADDLLPDLLSSNPHADRFGNAGVWRFEELKPSTSAKDLPPPLSAWKNAADADKPALAAQIKSAFMDLTRQQPSAHASSPLAGLFDQLSRPDSPFWGGGDQLVRSFPAEIQVPLEKLRSERDASRRIVDAPVELAIGVQDGGVPGSPHAGAHDVRVHFRGRYDRLGDVVPRGFPRILAGDHSPEITTGSGRLELARWLARPDHPLTARVLVNRVWQHYFGVGLVRTPDNFGRLGQPPTHPELLDWLADEFVASGWSLKSLHRSILRSAAYQQSSRVAPGIYAADPENLAFSRMHRRRQEAEALRDALLAVSGRLDLALGGPALKDLNSNRRTLYLLTVRSDRSSFRELFDAADPTAVVARRNESTVAPQGLFMLNHPFVLECSRAIAARLDREIGADENQRIHALYEWLFSRPPNQTELQIGRDVVRGSDWSAYCQALVCSNEFLYVD